MAPTGSPSNLPSLEVDIDTIVVGDRLRTDFGDIDDLAESIAAVGLIQPIVLNQDNTLVAGERRFRAHRKLGRKTIKVVYLQTLDEGHKTILEATENIQRKNFDWKEIVLGIEKVHSLKTTENALLGQSWGVRETGRLLNTAKSSINRAVILAQYIKSNDPDIVKCEGPTDAIRILLQRQENEAAKLLVASSLPKSAAGTTIVPQPTIKPVDVSDDAFFSAVGTTGFTPGIGVPLDDGEETPGGTNPSADAQGSSRKVTIPLSSMLLHVDARDFLRSVPAETFDACVTDWPYGIDMDMLNQSNPHGGMNNIDSVKAEHTVEGNEALHADFLPLLYRALKPNAWFITWTDAMQWQRGYDLAVAAGFKVQRWPLVWHKTSACMNQTNQYNFTKNFEIAMVCRKGSATLLRHQGSSIFTAGNDAEAKALGHPFVKPFALWDWLLNATCVRGTHVLEPFAGSGSAVIPMLRAGLKVTACEVNANHHAALNVNIQNFYRSIYPDCTFS